jgi:predicted deacylase
MGDAMRHTLKKQALLTCFIFLLLLPIFPESSTDQTIQIGALKVRPGEVKSGFLQVPEKNGVKTKIPITVINGKQLGKTLALVAGVHGYEYPPILALYRLKKMVSPESLTGALILVHVANLPSFQRRTIYYNPFDWKNLNRVFPGNPEGTLSQRIAYVLTEEVIKKCSCLIDLHCGDGNEALIPYTYWPVTGNSELDHKSKELALAFGIDKIIIDKNTPKDLSRSTFLENTAALLLKPAIAIESGYLGRTDEEDIVRVVKGVLSVMKLMKMIPGKPVPVRTPVWIDKYQVIYSETDGLFFPKKKMGDNVEKGELLGYTTDYFGNRQQELTAPFEGILLYILNTPPTNKGEPLFEIGHIREAKSVSGLH